MKFEVAASAETNPDTFSKAIMHKSGAKYSHILIIVDEKWVYQATGEGVNRVLLSEFLVGHTLPWRKDITSYLKKDHQYLLGWLDGNLGKEYSTSQIIGFLLPSRLAKKISSNGNEKFICSEFGSAFAIVGEMFDENTFVSLDLTDPKAFVTAVDDFEQQQR